MSTKEMDDMTRKMISMSLRNGSNQAAKLMNALKIEIPTVKSTGKTNSETSELVGREKGAGIHMGKQQRIRQGK